MRIASGVTDQYVYFVAVDATDFTTRETNIGDSNNPFTVYYARNGGAATAMTTPTVNEVDPTNMPGVYELLLDEGTTLDAGDETQELVLHITDRNGAMAPVTRTIEIYRPKITVGYTLGVGSDGDLLEVNTLTGHTAQTGDSYARLGAPAGASIAADIATVDTVVDGIQTDLSNGTDGLGAIKTAVDAIPTSNPTAADIADAVLDEALSGHTTAGTLGKAVADIETDVTAILADTNELQTDDVPGLIAALNDPTAAAIADAVWTEAIADHSGTAGSTAEALGNATAPTAADVADAVWDEALAGHLTAGSTGEALNAAGASGDPWTTTLPGSYTGSQAGKILADVLVDTAEIGAAGAGLTAVPWNASWDAEVESEVTDALNAYDPPTKAELDSGFAALNDPTAAAIADAVWDEPTVGHTTAGTFGEQVKTDIDAILVDTAEIGAAGAGLTAVPWNASWDAEVQSECTDALNAYDPPTKAELDSGLAALNDLDAAGIRAAVGLASADLDTQLDALPTATENADALLNRDMSAVSDTTARSPLNALRALRNKVTVSGGTATVYKEDDSTSAWTSAVTTDASADNITESDPT